MAFSTDGWGTRPTPWSMSLLMVSRVSEAGWALACWTPSSQRACSSLTLRRGSSGSSTSKSKLTSNRLWISATLGTSSARTFSLCCWKSSMRFKSSWRKTSIQKSQNWCFNILDICVNQILMPQKTMSGVRMNTENGFACCNPAEAYLQHRGLRETAGEVIQLPHKWTQLLHSQLAAWFPITTPIPRRQSPMNQRTEPN